MNKIPFEERHVIDELVEFWQTRCEPRDLLTHIAGTLTSGGGEVTWFFAQVRQDLCSDKRSKYAACSASEFKQFLEDEYRRLDPANTQRQAQEERQKRARASFDALGKEMAKTATRAELVELGRKRANLAPHTGFSYAYINHCWNCKKPISSDINAQCPNCRFYICSSCDSCFCK